MKTFALVLAAILVTAPVQSFADRVDRIELYERKIIRKAEVKRARELGGYSNPISAFVDLLNGRLSSKDIQRPFTFVEAREYLRATSEQPKQD